MEKKRAIKITANHQALGTVDFVVQATDAKSAFELWKQIVFSARQWRVLNNYGPAPGEDRDLALVDSISGDNKRSTGLK